MALLSDEQVQLILQRWVATPEIYYDLDTFYVDRKERVEREQELVARLLGLQRRNHFSADHVGDIQTCYATDCYDTRALLQKLGYGEEKPRKIIQAECPGSGEAMSQPETRKNSTDKVKRSVPWVTKQRDMPAAECLRWLAEREQDCPDCYGTGVNRVLSCGGCQGTGRVPMFPTLRQVCPCLIYSQTDEGYDCTNCGWLDGEYVHDPDCEPCQGRGWVVAEVHLEDLTLIAQQLGFGFVVLSVAPSGMREARLLYSVPLGAQILSMTPESIGYGQNPGEALARALVAAVRAQEEKV